MPKMSGGRFLAETLKGYGVTHFFFVPAIMRKAMPEMEKLGISRIVTHGEKAAAYMADGYARASNRPGVCGAQSVGAANLAAGLQDAYLARSPVIAITGRKPVIQQYRHAYQEIDHFLPFESVTKCNLLVDGVEHLPQLMRQAFREATSGAPGPVHLDILGNQGEVVTDGEADLEVIVEEPFSRVPALRTEPEAERVREAARVLSEARRPIIVAGGGVRASQAKHELVELAEMLSIPVATSLNAKDTIPDDHPLSVGVSSSHYRWCASPIISEADLVVFIGSHTGSQVTYEWTLPPKGTPVIQIDIDPSELGRTYPAAVALQGDAKVTLRKLIEAMEPMGPRAEWLDRVRQLVVQWRAYAEPLRNSDAVPIRPERICKEITDCLPPDAMVVSDTGHAGIWSGSMIQLHSPDQGYIRCAGTLGWGLSAAMGAKCALPDQPVLCFTGDGGFWYHIAELETALRYGINTVTVVNNNHSLNQEKRGIERIYTGQPGNSDELWQFLDVDLAQVARAIGCHGVRVEKPGQIRPAIEEALASGKPALVDVASDIEVVAPLP